MEKLSCIYSTVHVYAYLSIYLSIYIPIYNFNTKSSFIAW